jgi:hypothetical protein
MHHAVLAYPFLILAAAYAIEIAWRHAAARGLRKRMQLFYAVCIILFIVLNGVLLWGFFRQKILSENDFSRDRINRILDDDDAAGRYIYVVADWGMYFYQGLYGDRKQSVVYVEPLDHRDQMTALYALSREKGRRLLFIYNASKSSEKVNLVNGIIPVQQCRSIPDESVWRIVAENANTIAGCRVDESIE